MGGSSDDILSAGGGRARYRIGLILVTGSAVAWSTAGFFTRLIALDSWTMLFWRGVFGALGVLIFMVAQEGWGALRGFRSIARLSWAYAVVSALGMIGFITSLGLTTVAHVSIIYGTVPFVTAGFAWLLMRELASASAAIASLVALAGVVIMVGLGGAESSVAGDLLALGMTASMAVMTVIARRDQGLAILPAVCLSALISAGASWCFAGTVAVSGSELVELALFGLVNSAVGLVLFTLGSRRLPAIETALIGSLDAPLAPIWVWLVFAETPRLGTIAGGVIVFAAVALHILAGSRAVASRVAVAVER